MAPTILIADDDPLMQRLYRHHIEREGWGVIEATNGRQAIELAGSEKPQVVVMDIMMPDMDGLAAILELKRADATKAIPVIAMTSDPKFSLNRDKFAECGAASFLTKPFSPAQLLDAIRRVLPDAPQGS